MGTASCFQKVSSYYVEKTNSKTINVFVLKSDRFCSHQTVLNGFSLLLFVYFERKFHHELIQISGLCLLRPTTKLVELVAQAINDSPDSMLQVQQVYVALQ